MKAPEEGKPADREKEVFTYAGKTRDNREEKIGKKKKKKRERIKETRKEKFLRLTTLFNKVGLRHSGWGLQ